MGFLPPARFGFSPAPGADAAQRLRTLLAALRLDLSAVPTMRWFRTPSAVSQKNTEGVGERLRPGSGNGYDRRPRGAEIFLPLLHLPPPSHGASKTRVTTLTDPVKLVPLSRRRPL